MADWQSRLLQSLRAHERLHRRRRLTPRRMLGTNLLEEGGQCLKNFGSNDYLGLVAEPIGSEPDLEVDQASGATASALVCGWTDDHQSLSDQIADLEQTEAAVLFPSGYAACSGAIAALAGPKDLLLCDQLNHASLIDGCRLSKAERLIYPHGDVDALADLLKHHREQYEQTFIVSDSVFSMDGDLAPLQSIVRISSQFDAVPVIDEAHGTGVFGENGSGLCEELGLQADVPVRIGTLSKAIGHQGGFVAGPRVVIDTLIQHCRTLIYSTALSPMVVRSASRIVARIPDERERRDRVQDFASRLRARFGQESDGLSSRVPIIPIVLGDDAKALRVSDRLREEGFFVPAIRPPTVPDGTARLRISLSAAHRWADIEDLGLAIERTTSSSLLL